MAMNRDEFVERYVTGVLARAAVLHRMGVLQESPVMARFCPQGKSDIEMRIERYIFGYHSRTGEWPRVGQVMSTTRQNSAELLDVVRRSELFELRSADSQQTSAWMQKNGGLLASNIVVLLYLEKDTKHETNEVAVLSHHDHRHLSP